jgi:Tfp pilus assembly ATPase PilU
VSQKFKRTKSTNFSIHESGTGRFNIRAPSKVQKEGLSTPPRFFLLVREICVIEESQD